MFKRAVRVKKYGVKKYSGNAEEICRQIVKDCWNGRYFQTSAGHFCEFWTRDFGWCTKSLIKLGYEKEVKKTLEYALSIFKKNKKVTTTISPDGVPFDFPRYSPDSLAYLINSIALLKEKDRKELVEKYKDLLNREISRHFKIVFDPKTDLVKANVSFSSMKDYSKRYSSTYDNTMTTFLKNKLAKLKLENPYKEFDIKNSIKENLWNGSYFYNDMKKEPIVTGDSNVFPFWTEVFTDKNMTKSAIQSIQKEGLDKPFPLKYEKGRIQKMIFLDFLNENYEGNSIWAHMAMPYIEVVSKIDRNKAKEYIEKYSELIEKNGNYLEVFDPDGTPFKSAFYYADEGMLWAANYLALQ